MAVNREIKQVIRRINKMNHLLLLNCLIIVVISVITIYSATISRTQLFYRREMMWAGVGVVVYIAFSFIDYRKYGKYHWVMYGLNISMLVLVYFIGITRLGAKRWIGIGSFTVQPSEFAKILLILSFSKFLVLNYKEKRFDKINDLIITAIYIIPTFVLIAKQPDLGTAVVILGIYSALVFLHGLGWKLILSSVVSGILMIPIGFFYVLKPYQQSRILAFLNPEADALGSNWNVLQSLIAIGSGGIYGKGFMNNTQSNLRFLPEAHTDFIGSVFLEERGLVGGMLLLFLYLVLILQIVSVANTTEDQYGKLICYGIASIFVFHVFVNLGMIMGIMPVTGLPLLFMSYGGSSLVFSFMMLGIVQSVKVYRGE